MKVRTRFQPTVEVEMSDAEAAAHKHQGLLWDGTPAELAALYEEAGLPAPAPAGKTSTAGTTVTAATTTAKES
jgi:hypothetical protein